MDDGGDDDDGAFHSYNRWVIALMPYLVTSFHPYDHSHCDANDCGDDSLRCLVDIWDRDRCHRASEFVNDVDNPLEMNSLFIQNTHSTQNTRERKIKTMSLFFRLCRFLVRAQYDNFFFYFVVD